MLFPSHCPSSSTTEQLWHSPSTCGPHLSCACLHFYLTGCDTLLSIHIWMVQGSRVRLPPRLSSLGKWITGWNKRKQLGKFKKRKEKELVHCGLSGVNDAAKVSSYRIDLNRCYFYLLRALALTPPHSEERGLKRQYHLFKWVQDLVQEPAELCLYSCETIACLE